jgi:3-keto-5-aminohexanoate cleavage enzyme
VRCQSAGAAVIHVHIRNDEAKPTLDVGRLKDTVAALRASTDLIVQLCASSGRRSAVMCTATW